MRKGLDHYSDYPGKGTVAHHAVHDGSPGVRPKRPVTVSDPCGQRPDRILENIF
jgi:hypothetical protein